MSESQSLYIFHGRGFHDCVSAECEAEQENHGSFLSHSSKNRNAIERAALWVCVGACVCVCVCEKSEKDWVWIGMHWLERVSSKQKDSHRCFLFSGYSGGLAECWADGREVEKPAERPGAVLQRPGLTVRPGHCAYQAAQQVRGWCRRAGKRAFFRVIRRILWEQVAMIGMLSVESLNERLLLRFFFSPRVCFLSSDPIALCLVCVFINLPC